MGMGFVKDGIGCTEVMEKFHDALHVAAFLGAGEEFTVRERAGPTFAETIVRFGIQTLISIQQRDIFLAFADFLAALVDDGFDTVFKECESGEQTCRSCANNDGGTDGVMYILEDRRGVERDRCVLGDRFALIVGKYSKMHAQLALPCIY